MDRFIEQNGVYEDEWNLVFVDSIDDYYDEASEAPIDDESSPNSPFIFIHRKDTPRMSPNALEASRGYRVGDCDRLLCHHGREVKTRQHCPARVRREGS